MRKIFTASVALMIVLTSTAALAAPPAMQADSSLGMVMVDAKGMTLYTFDEDQANTSNCYDECATNWPPFMAAEGAQPEGEWTLVQRTDGGTQWAYEGKPLYLWAKDTKPGDVTGDGVGEVWHVVKVE